MSKHHKHKHHHHHEEKPAPKKDLTAPAEGADQSVTASDSNEAAASENDPAEAEAGEGVFQNVAELDASKSGGHAPVAFIPPHTGNDLSAQASLAAHAAAAEDKDPEDVPQELSHKEILDGAAGEPSAPKDVMDDLPGEGKNPDAQPPTESDAKKDEAVGSDAPAADAGQATESAASDSSTAPSTDGSAKDITDLSAATDVAADKPVTDSSVPSAS